MLNPDPGIGRQCQGSSLAHAGAARVEQGERRALGQLHHPGIAKAVVPPHAERGEHRIASQFRRARRGHVGVGHVQRGQRAVSCQRLYAAVSAQIALDAERRQRTVLRQRPGALRSDLVGGPVVAGLLQLVIRFGDEVAQIERSQRAVARQCLCANIRHKAVEYGEVRQRPTASQRSRALVADPVLSQVQRREHRAFGQRPGAGGSDPAVCRVERLERGVSRQQPRTVIADVGARHIERLQRQAGEIRDRPG